MSQRVTKCTVCGQAGHTRIHCLVLCGSCSGDSRNCGCEQPPAKKKQKTKKGRKEAEKEQLQVAAATGSPEAQPNYKSICRQLQQKNQQLGKAYHDLKAQFDELEDSCQEKEEQLAQAQQDADEMADMVRENEQRIATYTEQLKEKDDRIKELEQELRSLKNSSEASSANHEAAAKVDRNDLAEIHRRYAAVLSTLNAKKCSLNNAYRLAGTARSTIRDFIGIAELKIANEVTYQSTLERLGDPKLSVKGIEQECRRQLGGLLLLVKRLRTAKKLLPLALDDAFYS